MDKFDNIKAIVLKRTKMLLNYMRVNWQVSAIAGLGFVLVILIFAVVLPNTHRNIRVKQADALVMVDVKDIKQVKTVNFDQLEDTIRKNDKILVAIVDPNDRNYEQFIAVLNDQGKMSEFTGTLYFYPVVYNLEKVTDFYKLSSGISLIYFENQQEVERINLTEQQEIELYLVDHLNSLIRPSGEELDRINEEKQLQESQASSQAPEEEVIDELQPSATNTSSSAAQ